MKSRYAGYDCIIIICFYQSRQNIFLSNDTQMEREFKNPILVKNIFNKCYLIYLW